MENPGGPKQESQELQELPVVTRGIINYFLIAENLPPESFEPDSLNNPIRFIWQNKEISEKDRRYFLEKLAHKDYRLIQARFFEGLVSRQSPAALSENEIQRNLDILRNDPDQMEILDIYYGNVKNISLDPKSLDSSWGVYSTRKRIQGANPKKVFDDFQRFLTLIHGEKAFEFAKQFSLLQAEAIKTFGEAPNPWERSPKSGKPNSNSRERSGSTGFGNRPNGWTRPSYGWAPPPESEHQSSWDEPANRFKNDWGDRKFEENQNTPPPPKQEAKKPPTIDPRDPKGFFKVLGLDPIEMQMLSPEEYALRLKKAYRKAALATHTDVGGSREAIVAVNLANDFLSNPLNRRTYGK